MKELDEASISALQLGKENDPFAFLGVHTSDSGTIARAYLPGAQGVSAEDLDGAFLGPLKEHRKTGFFEGELNKKSEGPINLKVQWTDGSQSDLIDPYSFCPVLGPMDDHLVGEGSHNRLFDKLGAHLLTHQGVEGVHFAVWAPNAHRVSVVGDFNHWDGRRHVMRFRRDSGVWEIFLPGVKAGAAYKFEILGADGNLLPLKADPFAFQAELRPSTASIVAGRPFDDWSDEVFREHKRRQNPKQEAISIYEVHAGSWNRDEQGLFLNWDMLAVQLLDYVVDMGFTHIEFLPITEHPLDASWGYQVTGLFAPSARFGPPEGFARFVNAAHERGIGVIVDWVPAHFPTDDHGLSRFDGTSLYEHEDPRLGFHPDWNTAIYNYGRVEVVSFLINNALFWAERYHVDGLRVDAVASMLYLDYSRQKGQWLPNKHGGRENLEAIRFLKTMNERLQEAHPGVMTIAEESTAWPGVSRALRDGGLGFDFKWNMGFMHDTLRYLARDPVHRSFHHDDITFGLLYAFSENFVLPLSHDEVVHGKSSILHKMHGDDPAKFSTMRAYLAMMWGYPGKKHLFMGQEFAQRNEWNEDETLDWNLLNFAPHKGVQTLIRDLNRLYRELPSLHVGDCVPDGFEWIIADAKAASVFAWSRKAPDQKPVVVISHFTPELRQDFEINLPACGSWREILNTDSHVYGGTNIGNLGSLETDPSGRASIVIPPFTTLMLIQD